MSTWVWIAIIAVVAVLLAKRTNKKADEIHLETTPVPKDTGTDLHKDAWEGTFYDGEDPKSVDAYLEINYVDGEGKKSNRVVKVRKFDHGLYGGMIMAHCEVRDATRTFRYDRINKCVDIETGEVISDIRAFLTERYEKSLEHTMDNLFDDLYDVLRTIFFVARADGAFRKPEKEVVCEYLKKLTKDERITVDSVSEIFGGVELPSLHAFKMAVGRVAKDGIVEMENLFQCCKEIVGTQKTVSPSEQEALDYIGKKIA
ncbi:hypothetical protein ACFL0S_01045 [Thermodesulfobacteriota bacterium]